MTERQQENTIRTWQVRSRAYTTMSPQRSRRSHPAAIAERGCAAELIGDSAKMNIRLHEDDVLARIAANGGNVKKNLLD
jgi:hypothetical protein